MKLSYSQAEKLAIFCLGTALLLLFVSPRFAVLPLAAFLFCCSVAPFIPQWGFFLPVISKAVNGSNGIALTFDDGPTAETTPLILELLARYNYQATFFVVGEKAARYPDLIGDILAAGHTIGNHSWKHDSFLMLRKRDILLQDIQKTQQQLAVSGIRPLFFRPPIGISNPLLKSVLEKEGMKAVTFSCRAFDGGNRKIHNLSQRIMKKIRQGDIVLLHDLLPIGAPVSELLTELDELFSALQKGGYSVASLEKLLEMPAMLTVDVVPNKALG